LFYEVRKIVNENKRPDLISTNGDVSSDVVVPKPDTQKSDREINLFIRIKT